jgi:phosphate:Na+ symporter
MIALVLQMLTGLGVFLFGMASLEQGIEGLSGRRIKRWITNATGSGIKSAGFGAMATALLQSSSMVSLLVLAFASAGTIPLFNAIGVIIGSNLGTTLKGWIIAAIGIKLDLGSMALPMLGAGGLLQVFTSPSRAWYHWGRTVVGLGLLLLGLSLMKDTVSSLPGIFDIAILQGHHPVVYLLAGTALTAVIQSSSATVMITLSALYGNLISLPEAAALVIGADLGTTSTTILGSLAGASIKRQLALAQLAFNVAVDLFAFLFLLPLLPWLLELARIDDPLYGVVAFHSLINLLGLLAFIPVLRRFSNWVGRYFRGPENPLDVMTEVAKPVPEAALPVLVGALRQLWLTAILNTLRHFAIRPGMLALDESAARALAQASTRLLGDPSPTRVYETLREQESAIFALSNKLQEAPLDASQSTLLADMQELARSVVYASKTMQDIAEDVQALRAARHEFADTAGWQFTRQREFLRDSAARMVDLVTRAHEQAWLDDALEELGRRNDEHYRSMDTEVYQRARQHGAVEPALSIQLNVNREIHHASRNLLNSIRLMAKIGPPPPDSTGIEAAAILD